MIEHGRTGRTETVQYTPRLCTVSYLYSLIMPTLIGGLLSWEGGQSVDGRDEMDERDSGVSFLAITDGFLVGHFILLSELGLRR
jgi:hypothetical protein